MKRATQVGLVSIFLIVLLTVTTSEVLATVYEFTKTVRADRAGNFSDSVYIPKEDATILHVKHSADELVWDFLPRVNNVTGGSYIELQGRLEDGVESSKVTIEVDPDGDTYIYTFTITYPPITGLNIYWIASLALLAMAAGFVVIRKTKVLRV